MPEFLKDRIRTSYGRLFNELLDEDLLQSLLEKEALSISFFDVIFSFNLPFAKLKKILQNLKIENTQARLLVEYVFVVLSLSENNII